MLCITITSNLVLFQELTDACLEAESTSKMRYLFAKGTRKTRMVANSFLGHEIPGRGRRSNCWAHSKVRSFSPSLIRDHRLTRRKIHHSSPRCRQDSPPIANTLPLRPIVASRFARVANIQRHLTNPQTNTSRGRNHWAMERQYSS